MPRGAALLLRAVSLLVPAEFRAEWLEEWMSELSALTALHADGARGTPGAMEFVAGAFPHALWTRTEGWTMDSVLQDFRYAGRMLKRSPGFTAVAALTLALGIGANGTIFTLVNGLVLRPPAGIVEPDRLVQIARSYATAPRWDNFSWPAMQTIRDEARTLSGVAGMSAQAFVVGRGSDVERAYGHLVTGNFFEVLGVTPTLGRLIQPADDLLPGGHPVVVLSHALWTRKYGADPGVVGSTILLGSQPYEVLGVTPRGFVGADHLGPPPDLFVPTMQRTRGTEVFEEWGSSWIYLVGRLADGVSFEEAESSMTVVASRLREADPVNEDMVVLLARGVGLDPEARRSAGHLSLVLLLIVGLVLLITCTNVANLLLSRAATRRTEVGVRVALGAGRGRLLRQFATESLMLALLATLLSVPIVAASSRVLPLVSPFQTTTEIAPDARVYLVLALTGLLAGLLFGLAPAWASTRRVALTLRESSTAGGMARTRLRDALVVAQLGLSLSLVAGAALLGRSVANAAAARPGFEPEGVVAASLDLFTTGRYDETAGLDFFRRVLAQAEDMRTVRSATLASQLPIVGAHARATVRPAGTEGIDFEAEYTVVGPRYFETLGIPIVRGRALRGFGEEPERVVVVNEALAAMFWPGQDPVGREIERRGEPWVVVGVSGDVQMRSLRSRAMPAVYFPLEQEYSPFMALQVAATDASVLSPDAIRSAVASVDPELPVPTVVDLQGALVDSMSETRTIARLVGAFAGLALVLAVVGLYGLVSYGASQRVREIGIRVALGARPDSLVRLILGRALGVAGLGILLGLAIAYALGRALGGLLFGVGYADPITLGASAVLLLGAAAIAAWLPARKASRVDALVSLRS